MSICCVGLVIHHGRPEALAAADRVRAWCNEAGLAVTEVDVWTDVRRNAADEAHRAGDPDLVVTVGGDGTFLRGVRVAAAVDAAVMGVDLGRVGFLTDIAVDAIEPALDAVLAGTALIEERLTLTMRASRPLSVPAGLDALLRYGRGPALPPPALRKADPEDVGWGVALDVTAVNDVVFEKLARDRQASLGVYVGQKLFASYSADALVVASPTGSTAYSFAAGGPVLSPRVEAVVFTPVAPHMVFDRSLVMGADEVTAVRVLERSGRVAVSIDGQLRGVLEPGDWAAVYAGRRRARLVRMSPQDFFGRLRARLGLTDARAATADGEAPQFYSPDGPIPEDLAHLHLPHP
ncbi:MAG: NAD(+)/NADH kinase [bacterium]